jgi:hypothetical protein
MDSQQYKSNAMPVRIANLIAQLSLFLPCMFRRKNSPTRGLATKCLHAGAVHLGRPCTEDYKPWKVLHTYCPCKAGEEPGLAGERDVSELSPWLA